MNFALFYQKIWSYQKKAVPLHPLSKRKYIGDQWYKGYYVRFWF